jgi:hypothetical protein
MLGRRNPVFVPRRDGPQVSVCLLALNLPHGRGRNHACTVVAAYLQPPPPPPRRAYA